MQGMDSSRARMANWISNLRPDRDGTYTIRGPTGFDIYIPEVHSTNSASSIQHNSAQSHFRSIYGNFRPLFRGRVVLGPQPTYFIIHLVGLLFILMILGLQSQEIENQFGDAVLIMGLLLYAFSLLLFLCISMSDPGVVPRNYSMADLIAETTGYRERNPGQRFHRYCSKCDGLRPPRCYHCNRCNVCIRDQECHLLAGGICVGERTARSLFWMTFAVGALAWYLIVINVIILIRMGNDLQEKEKIGKSVLTFISLLCGVSLMCIPQVGIILFLFRIYYIGAGNTFRTFYNSSSTTAYVDCVADERKTCQNYYQFFFGKKRKSVFRKKRNQIEPEFGLENHQDWITASAFLQSRDSRELIHLLQSSNEVDFNNNPQPANPTSEEIEALLLRGLAANARPKSIPSVPDLHKGELEQVAGTRLKTPLKSKPCQLLHLQIEQFQKDRQLSKSVIANRKHHSPTAILSEGNIPRTTDGAQHLLTAARAEQFKRVINLLLLRDREGLVQMARRINLAGLLGMDQFDPDNLQFVELSNGLPMLAPRRRDNQIQFNRIGGLLGIPQMVAAGLLPTARQMALDAENQLGLGPGSVVRVPNHHRHPRQGQDPNAIRARLTIPLQTLSAAIGSHSMQNQHIQQSIQQSHQNHQNQAQLQRAFAMLESRSPPPLNSPPPRSIIERARAMDRHIRQQREIQDQTQQRADLNRRIERDILDQQRLQSNAMQRLRSIAYSHPIWGRQISRPAPGSSNIIQQEEEQQRPIHVNVNRRGFQPLPTAGIPSTGGHPPIGTILIDNLDPSVGIVSAVPTLDPTRSVRGGIRDAAGSIDLNENNNINNNRNDLDLVEENQNPVPTLMVIINDGTIHRPQTRHRNPER